MDAHRAGGSGAQTYLPARELRGTRRTVWLLAPIGGTVWQAPDGLVRDALLGLYVFGWLLLLYTTFLIDHFDFRLTRSGAG